MKRGMVKFGLVMACMLLMTLGLIGCGGNGNSGADGGSSGGEKVTLTLWADWTEDRPEYNLYKDKVDTFNKKHPNIEIKYVGVPHAQIETKLRTAAAGDSLPDLFHGYVNNRMLSFIQGKTVMPIDDIMDNWKGEIPEALLDPMNFNGKQYAIPSNVSATSLIFYHKSMLEKVGYDKFPKTFDEFKTMIKKLNDANVTPIALGNNAPWVLQSCYLSSIGDRITGSDFLPKVQSGDAKFTSDQFVRALKAIKQLKDIHAFNEDFNTIKEARSRSYFIQGKAAMHVAGSWALGPILTGVSDKSDIGVAVFPKFKGGDGNPSQTSATVGGGIYVKSGLSDAEKKAAKSFLKYFYDKELYKNLAKVNVLVPVDVNQVEGLTNLYKQINAITSKGVTPVYDATLKPEVIGVMNPGLQSITIGSTTPEKLAKKLQQTIEEQ
ncbi:MAG TPA: extracellular solute-binding protein [Bacillales bacterium]|nr:extracellular solute-binding protein [Bacillales bacterium]